LHQSIDLGTFKNQALRPGPHNDQCPRCDVARSGKEKKGRSCGEQPRDELGIAIGVHGSFGRKEMARAGLARGYL